MKIILFTILATFLACATSVFVPPRPGYKLDSALGPKECAKGAVYWCQNLTNAADCHATKHCIQTVWIHKTLPPDTTSICQTCLDMVKQARDQLESNETQELIKEVFEGSCKLLHIKLIVKECDKIADDYIPDLIDTLASEMNPQVVCSVAGLCNSERVLRLIAEERYLTRTVDVKELRHEDDSCEGCQNVVGVMKSRFSSLTRDQVLQSFLEVCRKTSSLSDGCSNIVITYFENIYKYLEDNFLPDEICFLSGQCSAQFHVHVPAKVEITPISHIGYVKNKVDDQTCDFCKQLVVHLRDILIANTTELEFKKVLEGLCKQTKEFKAQCLGLVDEYYAAAYNFLLDELNPTEVCSLAGICPKTGLKIVPIAPLLPVETVKTLDIRPVQKPKNQPLNTINMAKDGSSVQILETPEMAQLPIERLMGPQIYNQQVCQFCEYLLHYLQQVITNPSTEEEIKKVIDGACEKLPPSINSTCVAFIDMYEPALVAMLAQEIDPSQVCPLIKACPSVSEVKDVEIFMRHHTSADSKCPLCLFAVTRLEEMVKDKKTEENIKNALNKLCTHLPKNLVEECDDFVELYSNKLVEMLIADLTPQEVCVYLKLCTDTRPPKDDFIITPVSPVHYVGGEIETNKIFDDTANGVKVTDSQPIEERGTQCVLCEFIMKEIDESLEDKTNEDEVKKVVHGICNKLPGSISKECNDFVDEYADTVIQLLVQAFEPKQICRMMKLCSSIQTVKVEIFECAVCESVVWAMEKILTNPKVDHTAKHVLEKACRALPQHEQPKCKEIIEKYGTTIFDLIEHLANRGVVCHEIGLCSKKVARPQVMVGSDKCTYGPSYWCRSKEHANQCGDGAFKHCSKVGWINN